MRRAVSSRRREKHRKPLFPRQSLLPRLEILEDRTVLSTWTVTSPIMWKRCLGVVAIALLAVPVPLAHAQAAHIHALFDLGTPTAGPFPSNWFTIPDESQNTGRRVDLPLPDPGTNPSDYQDTHVLNTLDGFNLQPRLSIPFDGAINVNTVNSQTVFLISLGDTLNQGEHKGEVVGVNQVVWDVATTTLHVESDELLAQHTRYALIVTNGIHDSNGNPVEATDDFRDFRETVYGGYNLDLLDAVHAARRLGLREQNIVVASVFTTQSATAILEKIRDQIRAATPAPADFNLAADGSRTVFALDHVTGITFNQQTKTDGPLNPVNVDLSVLQVIPGAVGQVAFGKYVSPDYEVHPGEYIPPVGTRTGTPAVQGMNEIYFNLFLPSGPKPDGGWPVAIFGHGNGGDKNGSLNVAGTMAAHGIATIAINAVGHGFGPLGTLSVNQSDSSAVTFPAGGRGIDQNGDHFIGSNEGLSAAPPRTIVSVRDGIRQTATDLMQLVRVIEVGMDVHGQGDRELDPARVYYIGFSMGANLGTALLAVDPGVRAGVLASAGRLIKESPPFRTILGSLLAARQPPLLNSPGISVLGGVSLPRPYFNDNLPLRDGVPLAVQLEDGSSQLIQSPVINTVAGAMAIQEVLDNFEWVSQTGGNPVPYAPHLRKSPLAGVPAKSVIVQFGKGDQSIPNPAETALVRAGDLADRVTFYRHDLAFAENPNLLKNPHGFMVNVAVYREIALGAQEQIARFFASDGTEIIHPEPARFFEVPIQGRLPEDLNFIP
jgi:dienelactone hydrolase